jgi:hypothetical protein
VIISGEARAGSPLSSRWREPGGGSSAAFRLPGGVGTATPARGLAFLVGGLMIEPRQRSGTSLRPGHGLTIVAAAVIAAIVAYVAFGWVVGIVWFLIKTIVVIAVIATVLYLVVRHARRGRL